MAYFLHIPAGERTCGTCPFLRTMECRCELFDTRLKPVSGEPPACESALRAPACLKAQVESDAAFERKVQAIMRATPKPQGNF